MRAPIVFLLFAFLTVPALAKDWFRPAHAGRDYVNPDLSPQRAMKGPVKSDWDGQLVLWPGVVTKQGKVNGKHTLTLHTGGGDVEVFFPKKVLNLESDRKGFKVAVKGHLELSQPPRLSGRSVILLDGPPGHRYSPPSSEVKHPAYAFLARRVQLHNPQYTDDRIREIAEAIVLESLKNKLDPLFLASLIQVESAFDVDARSVSGAIGLGQLMPFTADGLGVDPYDIRDNVRGAARMISGLVREWEWTGNGRASALASYNAGPNLVRQLGGRVPRYSQTTNYVYFIGFVHKQMTRALARQS